MPPPVASLAAPASLADARPDGAKPATNQRSSPSAAWALDLVLLAFVLCLALWWRSLFLQSDAPTFVTPDSDDYLRPAYDLAHGLGFDPELRRTPLYPALLAVIIASGGNLASVAIAQHALGVATAGLTYCLGRATYGWLAGLVAGLAVAFSGPLIIYEHYLMAESLFTALVTAAVLVLVVALGRRSTPWLVSAGLLAGLAALTRPIGQALVVVALAMPIVLAPFSWRSAVRPIALIGIGILVSLAPWMLRNLIVHGTVGAEGALGQALIGRTLRHDRGFAYDDPSRPDPDPRRAAARRIIQEEARTGEPSGGTITARVRDELGLTQAQTGTLLRELALEAIATRPAYFVIGSAEAAWELFQGKNERLLGHWRQRTTRNWDRKWEPHLVALLDTERPAEGEQYVDADNATSAFQPWRWRWPITWLFVIGAVVSVVAPQYRLGLLPAVAAVALVVGAGTLDGPVWRFRYPADPLIAVVAAGGIAAPLALLAIAARRALARQRSTPALGG